MQHCPIAGDQIWYLLLKKSPFALDNKSQPTVIFISGKPPRNIFTFQKINIDPEKPQGNPGKVIYKLQVVRINFLQRSAYKLQSKPL